MESSQTVKRILWGIAFALIAIALFGNYLLAYRNTQMLRVGHEASVHSAAIGDAIDELLSSIKDAETGQRGYLLTGHRDYLEPYRQTSGLVGEMILGLKQLLADDPEQLQRLIVLEPLITAKLDEMARTVAQMQAGNRDAAIAIVATNQGLHTMQKIREDLAVMRTAEATQEARRNADAARLYTSSQQSTAIGMLVGSMLVLLAIGLLRRDVHARERAAGEIFQQKEWFSTTLRSIGDAVIVTDTDSRIMLLNEIAEKLTGWTAREATGKPLAEVFDIINEATREPAHNPVERALVEDRIVGLANHTVLRARDGKEYVIEDSAAPTRNAEGVVQGAVMVFHDSTQRRKSEIALGVANDEIARRAHSAMASERILNTILENAPIGISMTGPGPDFPIVVMSRQMHEWLGAGENEPSHKLYRKLLPDGSVPSPEQLPLNRAMRDGLVVRNEPWIVEAFGRDPFKVIVNVAPVRDDAGTIIGAVHSWVDLSEQQRLDRALRLTESRLRVLERSDVIGLILSFDRSGQVTQTNAAMLDMLGFSEAELAAGKFNLATHTPAEYTKLDELAFEELEEYGSCTPYEKEFFCNGFEGRIAVVVGYAKVADQENEYVGFALDLTERKKLEQQLRQQSESLMLADRRKDEFLAMLAHELRNPLAPLRNAVHLLNNDPHRDWKIVETTIPTMRRQIDHLVRMVDDLLDAARISQNKIILERNVVELKPLLEVAVETMQPLIAASGHHFKATLPPDSVLVNGDSARLVQLFSNILHNAIKYTDMGGRIELAATTQSNHVRVSIRDNGQGIDGELLPRIFDPFTQADQSLARSAGGLGVGLALVRRLVELHGGSVSAFSAGIGKGSEFVVTLPLATNPQRTQTGTTKPAELLPIAPALRVLLIDDNRDLAASTAALLGLWGHESCIVDNGNDAVAAALKFNPDVVLLDIGLPDIDGFEVAKLMRAQPSLSGVRLIAMTGYAQDRDRQRTRESGFDEHLVKPVEPDLLQRVIEKS